MPRQWPYYKNGDKNNSLRRNDRPFAVGDTLILRLWEDERFVAGEVCVKKVTHILHDYDFEHMPKGYCILSMRDVN